MSKKHHMHTHTLIIIHNVMSSSARGTMRHILLDRINWVKHLDKPLKQVKFSHEDLQTLVVFKWNHLAVHLPISTSTSSSRAVCLYLSVCVSASVCICAFACVCACVIYPTCFKFKTCTTNMEDMFAKVVS